MTEPNKNKVGAGFLLAEFNNLQEQARQIDQINASRANFLLLIAAAVIAALAAAADVQPLKTHYHLLAILAMAALLLMGLFTLREMILTAEVKIMLYRQSSRVRRWFAEFAPDIAKYVAFEIADDRPSFTGKYLVFRGGEGIVLMMNTILAGAIVAVMLHKFANNLWIGILVGAIAGVGTWLLQDWYVRGDMKRVERTEWAKSQVRFPSEESPETSAKNE